MTCSANANAVAAPLQAAGTRVASSKERSERPKKARAGARAQTGSADGKEAQTGRKRGYHKPEVEIVRVVDSWL